MQSSEEQTPEVSTDAPGGSIPGASDEPSKQREWNTLAVVGCALSFFLWPAGLVVSLIARQRMKNSDERGEELTVVGIAVSLSVALLSVATLVLVWAVFDAVTAPFVRHGERVDRVIDVFENVAEDGIDQMGEAQQRGAEFDRRFDERQREFDRRFDESNERFERNRERMAREVDSFATE